MGKEGGVVSLGGVWGRDWGGGEGGSLAGWGLGTRLGGSSLAGWGLGTRPYSTHETLMAKASNNKSRRLSKLRMM